MSRSWRARASPAGAKPETDPTKHRFFRETDEGGAEKTRLSGSRACTVFVLSSPATIGRPTDCLRRRDALFYRRRQIGGTMFPRLTAKRRTKTPVIVQTIRAIILASMPKAPPVKSSGPSITALTNPGCSKAPDTEPEKMPLWVKFQAICAPMLNQSLRVTR
jgi:hypothetical protein